MPSFLTVPATELAWAAGFFDGEGHIGTHHSAYPRMYICQADERPMRRWQTLFGGGMRVRTINHLGTKPIWEWRTSAVDKVMTTIGALWPYLSEPKREQAQRAFAEARAARTCPPGLRHPHQKLSLQQIQDIRQSSKSCRALGEEYGVSNQYISRIRRNEVRTR